MTGASTVTEVGGTVALQYTPRGLEVTMPPREITIGWGEDTCCDGCLSRLPAGAPAWAGDELLCAHCQGDADLRAAGEVPPAAPVALSQA
jgi:hypothetical protein